MKTLIKFFSCSHTLVTILFSIAVVGACTDDELPSTVQFSDNILVLPEGGETTIVLSLNRPASNSSSVNLTIETNAIYNEHYVSDPELSGKTLTVPFAKGQRSAEIKITSIDNALFDNGKFIAFTLTKATDNLRLGSVTTSLITFADDEGPSLVEFGYTRLPIVETDSEFLLEMPFSAPASGEGSITVQLTLTNTIYGEKFTTIPAAINNVIKLPVTPNSVSSAITLLLNDDNIFTGNFEIHLSITEVSGVVQKGKMLESFVTVHDNEVPSLISFKEESGVLSEDAENGIDIKLSLSKPVAGTGTLTLRFDSDDYNAATYGIDFTTVPAAVDGLVKLTLKDQEASSSFKVLPIKNSTCTDRITTFTFIHADGALQIGGSDTHTLTVKNDDTILTFSESSGTIAENSAGGVTVKLNLSEPAPEHDVIYIAGPGYGSTGELYGSVYTTIPGMTWDYYSPIMPVTIVKGTTSTTFVILPIDNTGTDDAHPLLFQYAYSNSGCFSAEGWYTLTIVDDE